MLCAGVYGELERNSPGTGGLKLTSITSSSEAGCWQDAVDGLVCYSHWLICLNIVLVKWLRVNCQFSQSKMGDFP